MNTCRFSFAGRDLDALPSGGLWDQSERLLCVSDLHLGKSDRIARRFGLMLPPYETAATLDRLAQDIALTDPATVVCLGDSFDDLAAADSLSEEETGRLASLMAGRRWIWIEGNHDPGPLDLGGTHLAAFRAGDLTFRHIATTPGGEVSGHYHPKHNIGVGGSRPCFVYDEDRLILPAYGAYTGGLAATVPVIRDLFGAAPRVILTGARPILAPLAAPSSAFLRR